MSKSKVILQINMYPPDIRHVVFTLPHQLKIWLPQADGVRITVDARNSVSGRYSGDAFSAHLAEMREFCRGICERTGSILYEEVDYSPAMRQSVSNYFFDAESCPDKAWDGGPFYAYFYGLYNARADYVLHMDSDMMYGGCSPHWVKEAVACLQRTPGVLFIAPLAGPPHLRSASSDRPARCSGLDAQAAPAGHAYDSVSTRVFLFDRARFERDGLKFPLERPSLLGRVKASILGNEPSVLEAETVLSRGMVRAHCLRLDYLGSNPGMWTLHPQYRSEEFYRQLPQVIRRVETGDIPSSQRGSYDIVDELIDWRDVRHRYRWGNRVRRQLWHAARYWAAFAQGKLRSAASPDRMK